MENPVNIEARKEQELETKFREFFPDGNITATDLDSVPTEVKRRLENYSQSFILPEEYRPNNFDATFVVEYPNGDKSYIAEQTKTYKTLIENEPGSETEKLSYIFDTRGEGISGHAELRYNISNKSKYFKNKPFVGYNDTEREFQRSGLGWRRIRLMNALARTKYDAPLYSDTLMSEQAEGLWQKLVKEGKVKKIKEGKVYRYVLTNWQS